MTHIKISFFPYCIPSLLSNTFVGFLSYSFYLSALFKQCDIITNVSVCITMLVEVFLMTNKLFNWFFKNKSKIFLLTESISALQRLQTFRIARNDLEVVNDLTYLRSLKELTHLRIDENPISLLERTVPYAMFCVLSLDTINGTYWSWGLFSLLSFILYINLYCCLL